VAAEGQRAGQGPDEDAGCRTGCEAEGDAQERRLDMQPEITGLRQRQERAEDPARRR